MFEPRHNILSNVRTDIRKYVVSWLKHSRESNRPLPGPHLAELSIVLFYEVRLIQTVESKFQKRATFWQAAYDEGKLSIDIAHSEART